jgi:hypothetical protein
MLSGLAPGEAARTPPTEEITMATRREFLPTGAGALAGLAFVGCNLLVAARARAQTRRSEVVVTPLGITA